MNAIMNKNSADVKNCTMYVALFPCNNCAKLIIQSGIKKVLYFSDKHRDKVETKASKKMLTLANVEYQWVGYCIPLLTKFDTCFSHVE